MQAVIESIVTAMVNAKIASADDSLEDFGLGWHARRDRRRSAAPTRRRCARASAACGRILWRVVSNVRAVARARMTAAKPPFRE